MKKELVRYEALFDLLYDLVEAARRIWKELEEEEAKQTLEKGSNANAK